MSQYGGVQRQVNLSERRQQPILRREQEQARKRQPAQNYEQQQQDGQTRFQQEQKPRNTPRPTHQLKLTEMTPELLQSLISNEKNVNDLTNCFEDFSSCTNRNALNLISKLIYYVS